MARSVSSTTCPHPTQIRALVRALGAAAIVAAGLFAVMGLYLVATPQDQLRSVEPWPAYQTSRLAERVGEYRLDDGRRVLVTPSARGGLMMYALHGARFFRDDYLSRSIVPRPDGSLEWQPFVAGTNRELRLLEAGDRAVNAQRSPSNRSFSPTSVRMLRGSGFSGRPKRRLSIARL